MSKIQVKSKKVSVYMIYVSAYNFGCGK